MSEAPGRRSLGRRYLALPLKGKAAVVWGLAGDRRVPLKARLLLPLLAVYLAVPLDLIPDFVPVLGYLDDLVAVVAAFRLFLRWCPSEVVEEHIRDREGGRPAA